MAQPLVSVSRGQSVAEVRALLAGETHNAFPVLAPDGTLDGLLLRHEMRYFHDEVRVAARDLPCDLPR